MKNKLPVYIENRDLPNDNYNYEQKDNSNSYGYVNTLYLISMIITIASVITIIMFGK